MVNYMEKKIIVWVGAFLKNKEGKFVVLRRSKTSSWGIDQWQLPGGKMEWGEKPEYTLSREVEEETGFKVSNPELVSVGTTNVIAKNVDHHAVQLFYKVDVGAEDPKIRISHEHDDYRLVNRDEALGMDLIEGLAEIIRKSKL